MTWEAVGALAELVGAAAVVVSLVYLAAQIRQSSRISGATAFLGIIDGNNEHFRFMFAPDNAELMAKGLRGFSSLSPTERMGFESLLAGLLNQVEASFITLRAQMMSEETMENWGWWLQTRLLCYQGARDWWEEARSGYD
ncbi:MAG TPA: hypothetical protein ENO08_04875, partial [Candidatus Eisenbacteria bacterium]|nr:hypothetical protein [Candidatus Eisenbacteria bacterium]